MDDRLSRVSIRLLYPFAAVLVDEGLSLDELLAPAAIALATYRDPHARISQRAAGILLATLLAKTKHAALGLRAAERHDLAQFHLLEYLAASSENVNAALTGLVRYQGLFADAKSLQLERRECGLLLRYDRPHPLVPHAVIEYVVGGLAKAALRVEDVAARPRHHSGPLGFAWFDYAEPAHGEQYREFFQGAVRFAMPANGLWIPQQRIEAKLVKANSQLLQLLEPQVQESLARIPGARSATDQVHAWIAKALPSGRVSLEETASKMHVSASTLKRKLAAETTSFSEILETVRRRAASSHLERSELTLHEVAYLLGYEDLTSFHRAFKRWTGLSPGEYRSQMRNAR